MGTTPRSPEPELSLYGLGARGAARRGAARAAPGAGGAGLPDPWHQPSASGPGVRPRTNVSISSHS